MTTDRGIDLTSGSTAAQSGTDEAEGTPPNSGGTAQDEEFQYRNESRLRVVAQMTTTTMARHLPVLVRRSLRMAWQVDRGATAGLLACQIGTGVLAALGLFAVTGILTTLIPPGDIADRGAQVTPDLAPQLARALHQDRLLVVPRQHPTHADLLTVASCFGTVDTNIDRRYAVGGFPGLTVISNTVEDGKHVGIYDGDEEEWQVVPLLATDRSAMLHTAAPAGTAIPRRSVPAASNRFHGPSPHPARPNTPIRTCVHEMSRDGARSDAFLEHQCHFPAQMEDIVNPAPAPVHQPSGFERRPAPTTVRLVDDTRSSARLDTRWAA